VYAVPVYGVEIIVLFAAGIASITFATVYKRMDKIKKGGAALALLSTSLLAFGTFLTFGVPIETSSSGTIGLNPFPAVLGIMVGIMVIAFSLVVFLHGVHDKFVEIPQTQLA